MTRDIERRLRKLESQVPPPQPTEEEKTIESLQQFLRCAVGYYLGDSSPKEPPVQGYMRALGYRNFSEFKKATEAKDPEPAERIRLANTKLLEKFGVSWEHEWEEIIEAFRRMHAGFSNRYKGSCGIEFD